MSPATFRTKTFLATFGVAAAGLIIASILISMSLRQQASQRIERSLASEARLAAELLSSRAGAITTEELEPESIALAHDIDAQVTLIAADGRVVGDSSQDLQALATLENHATRPEVMAARQTGIGVATRYSATLKLDMLYVAVPVHHPAIAIVRLALPLTEIADQLGTIWRLTLAALGLSLAGAFVLAWISSTRLAHRLDRVAGAARRYATGDFTQPALDYGADDIGTVALVLDDTVRQLGQRAAELARDRARMEAIVAGMVEGVLVIDGQDRLQLVNEAARRMLRLEDVPKGRHYLEFIRHPGIAAQLGVALDGSQPAGLEVTLARDPGRTFVARAAPVAAGGGSGAVLVLHDITDLHRADQIRRDFVANVSHELRTPLTAIRGYVEALRDEPADEADRKRFLEIIARHASRMERLVKDLLNLARLEAGQERLEQAPCDLPAALAEVEADLRPAIQAKQQRVAVRVDPDVAEIATDRSKLQDAVRNLLENAINYSPVGTSITVEARRDDAHAVITVADDGPGIPESDLSRIFERFYRVDKARSRDSGGTGLGLSIVKHLVDRLGGSVSVGNRQDGGAIFTITLPIRQSPSGRPLPERSHI